MLTQRRLSSQTLCERFLVTTFCRDDIDGGFTGQLLYRCY